MSGWKIHTRRELEDEGMIECRALLVRLQAAMVVEDQRDGRKVEIEYACVVFSQGRLWLPLG